jgi:hypothetical protein
MKVKKYQEFISESHNKRVHVSDSEMNLFSSESSLQKLITDNKITLKNGEVLFDENDMETKEILDQYLEIPGKVHESFDNTEINEREIDDFLGNGVRINVFLTDLLSETNLMLLMVNGEVYERRAGNKAWSKYSSKEEFKSKTGASLDDEYAGNASPELINLFDSVDDGRKHMIEMVYIDSQFDSPLLDSVLKNFK